MPASAITKIAAGKHAHSEEVTRRLRALLHGTFARMGYARMPAPPVANDGARLIAHEISRLLAESEQKFSLLTTRAQFSRAMNRVLMDAKLKVARDEAWTAEYARYAEEHPEESEMVRSVARAVPDEWRDL